MKNDYMGICVLIGGGSVDRSYYSKVLSERFPEALILIPPDDRPHSVVDWVDTIIWNHFKTGTHYIITTNNPLVLRAIEVYCDLYGCMSDLNVYCLEDIHGDIEDIPNSMYSNYGISEIYELWNSEFFRLQTILDRREEEPQ